MEKPEIVFGRVLRQFRKDINFSQEKLSQESGLDRTYISLLERGLRQPTLTSLLKLAAALGVSTVDLVAKVEVRMNENNWD
ncbi:MAG: XRE family transcriptional regulator [Gammaproteobacteria bacterium]|jgi:transcriptional regulator with XRE-family HTH domain|nr:MAG: XRE family transcriptional regulator [Gammaproteobacteria bacterium]